MNPELTLYTHTIAEQLTTEYGDFDSALHHAWELIQLATALNRTQVLTDTHLQLSAEQQTNIAQWVEEITQQHKPIQYIIGSVPFLDLNITVRPPILIPRPETEDWSATLVDTLKKAVATQNKLTLLDLCTGSGCIALALAKNFPACTVYATDISAQALALAQENALNNSITNVICIQSDLYKNLPQKTFDLIVANPPYIAPEEYASLDLSVSAWEDPRALVAPEHGLEIIHRIIETAPQFLRIENPFPQLWIEIGHRQADVVCNLFRQHNFVPHVLKDLSGSDRVVIGSLN